MEFVGTVKNGIVAKIEEYLRHMPDEKVKIIVSHDSAKESEEEKEWLPPASEDAPRVIL